MVDPDTPSPAAISKLAGGVSVAAAGGFAGARSLDGGEDAATEGVDGDPGDGRRGRLRGPPLRRRAGPDAVYVHRGGVHDRGTRRRRRGRRVPRQLAGRRWPRRKRGGDYRPPRGRARPAGPRERAAGRGGGGPPVVNAVERRVGQARRRNEQAERAGKLRAARLGSTPFSRRGGEVR